MVRPIGDMGEGGQLTPAQIIQDLFAQGQQGFWLPFTDFASLSQDSTGTLPYTALEQPVGRVLDRSGRGNHATQPTSTARGVVSARVNMFTETEFRGTGVITGSGYTFSGLVGYLGAVRFASNATTSYAYKSGSVAVGLICVFSAVVKMDDGSAPLTAAQNPSNDFMLVVNGGQAQAASTVPLGDGLYRLTTNPILINSGNIGIVKYSNNSAKPFTVTAYSLVPVAQAALPYQRVNTASDYDSVGFPKFLTFDGVDDRLQATLPAITGTWIVGYKEGTLVYKVNIPAGAFPIGTNSISTLWSPSKNFVGMVLRSGDLTEVEVSAVERYLVANGAGAAGVGAFAGVTNFTYAWSNCSSLTSFPLIDTSGGTYFQSAWQGCSSLTSFPLLDTSAGTVFHSTWYGCSSLTSFPLINTAAGTNFSQTWYGCTSLTSFPLIDTSGGTYFQSAWQGCTSLTSFPLINTAAGTNFTNAWVNCSSLTSFPLINTAAGTNFTNAWNGCTSLTSFPLISTAAGTNFQSAWFGCSSLTSFPLINTAAGTNFRYAWCDCTSLTSFPTNMFDSCPATNFANAFQNCALSQASVDGILASLVTAGKSNGTLGMGGGTSATPSAAGLASKATLVSRGWTVTHN